MDVWVKMKNKEGEIVESLIEIKPYVQTQPPRKQKKKTEQFINKVKTYAVNRAKWEAAKKYASKRGIQFKILTERGIINT